jgi:hypothetical protein
VTIATNDTTYVYLGTGRDLMSVPSRVVAVTGKRNPRFDREIREMAVVLARHHGVLALRRGDFATAVTATDFGRYATLTEIGRYPDAALSRVATNASAPVTRSALPASGS